MAGETPGPPPLIRMTIDLDIGRALAAQKGACIVNGPLKNKAVCYMMLEYAKDEVKKFAEKVEASTIVDPNAEAGMHSTGG